MLQASSVLRQLLRLRGGGGSMLDTTGCCTHRVGYVTGVDDMMLLRVSCLRSFSDSVHGNAQFDMKVGALGQ